MKRGQRGRLLNALAAAIGFGICLGVVAYAVTLPASGSARPTASAKAATSAGSVYSNATITATR